MNIDCNVCWRLCFIWKFWLNFWQDSDSLFLLATKKDISWKWKSFKTKYVDFANETTDENAKQYCPLYCYRIYLTESEMQNMFEKTNKNNNKNFKHVCEKYMRIFINFRIVTGCLNLMMNAKQRCVKITKAVLKPRHTAKNVQGTYASQGKNFFSMLVNVKLIYFGIQNQEYVKMQYKAVHASLLMCNKNIKFLKFI